MGSGAEVPDDIAALLAALRTENMALRTENAALLTRLTELEGLIAALHAQLGRDSSNSGKPPSLDSPFTKKPAPKRSLRTRSGKPHGKQPGAPSATLRLIDHPDDTITHTPPVCAGCGDDLADAEIFGVCRHQVFDIPPPPPRPYVTEHRVGVTHLSRVRHRYRSDRTWLGVRPGPVRAGGERPSRMADVRAFPADPAGAADSQRAAGVHGVRRVGRRAARRGRATAD